MAKVCIAGLVALACAGCTLLTGGDGRIYNAVYVGDRASVAFDEIVVAVPSKDRAGSVVNLHVVLTALINPTRTMLPDIRELQSILTRLAPRIAAAVVVAAQDQGPLAAGDLSTLREALAKEANDLFASACKRWAHAQHYTVTLVVTSFYLTDGSVGRASGRQRTGL